MEEDGPHRQICGFDESPHCLLPLRGNRNYLWLLQQAKGPRARVERPQGMSPEIDSFQPLTPPGSACFWNEYVEGVDWAFYLPNASYQPKTTLAECAEACAGI